MYIFGVKTLPGTLLGTVFNDTGYGARKSPRSTLSAGSSPRGGSLKVMSLRGSLSPMAALKGEPWLQEEMAKDEGQVKESACACSYYSISTGMQIGEPPAVPFWLYPFGCTRAFNGV